MTPFEHMYNKDRMISLTNSCNLSCGGCNQFCGHFKPDKIWFVTAKEFESYVLKLKKTAWMGDDRRIFLFGGEPTINPHLAEILKVCDKFKRLTFILQTNGYKDVDVPDNVDVWCDPKDPAHESRGYLQTGIAPIDLFPNKDKRFYFNMAQKHCNIWQRAECGPIIYNKKAYFCQVAAAMDNVFNDQKFGWSLKDDPFKNNLEQQADRFCYRCAWAMGVFAPAFPHHPIPPQFIGEPFIVTSTNKALSRSRCIHFCKKCKKFGDAPCKNKGCIVLPMVGC